MKGSTAYTADQQQFSIKPFPVEARKGFGGGDGYAAGFYMVYLKVGKLSIAWSLAQRKLR